MGGVDTILKHQRKVKKEKKAKVLKKKKLKEARRRLRKLKRLRRLRKAHRAAESPLRADVSEFHDEILRSIEVHTHMDSAQKAAKINAFGDKVLSGIEAHVKQVKHHAEERRRKRKVERARLLKLEQMEFRKKTE